MKEFDDENEKHDLLAELNIKDKKDYTLCFFISYSKLKALPLTDINKMKEMAEKQDGVYRNRPSKFPVHDIKNAIFFSMGKKYGTESNEIFRYW